MGLYVGCMWAACGLHVGCMCAACGLHVGCMWAACGLHVCCMWAASSCKCQTWSSADTILAPVDAMLRFYILSGLVYSLSLQLSVVIEKFLELIAQCTLDLL